MLKADLSAHKMIEIASGLREETYPGEARDALTALHAEYDQAWQLSAPGNQRDILDVERTLWGENWIDLPRKIQKAMQPGGCARVIWTRDFLPPFGLASELATKLRGMLACDPMDTTANSNVPFMLVWAGDVQAALREIDEAEIRGLRDQQLDDARFDALLAAGDRNDPMTDSRIRGQVNLDRMQQVKLEAWSGDPAVAQQMAEEFWSGPDANDLTSLEIAAVVGDRDRANKIAARIDAHVGSADVISKGILSCLCGAPFDLEATPNYKARIEEAGFPWPPPKRIDYPTKTW